LVGYLKLLAIKKAAAKSSGFFNELIIF